MRTNSNSIKNSAYYAVRIKNTEERINELMYLCTSKYGEELIEAIKKYDYKCTPKEYEDIVNHLEAMRPDSPWRFRFYHNPRQFSEVGELCANIPNYHWYAMRWYHYDFKELLVKEMQSLKQYKEKKEICDLFDAEFMKQFNALSTHEKLMEYSKVVLENKKFKSILESKGIFIK